MDDYLAHHGILGQKWGIRRFQNPDGSLTSEGREYYKSKYERLESKREKLKSKVDKAHQKTVKAQHKYDQFHPGLGIRLIAGKKWRAKLDTLNATRGYKLSKIRDNEYKLSKRLERLEKKIKRSFRDIPISDLNAMEQTWQLLEFQRQQQQFMNDVTNFSNQANMRAMTFNNQANMQAVAFNNDAATYSSMHMNFM